MDDIISKLSAIEDAAVSILDDANDEKKKLVADMQARTTAWDDEIHESTRNIIADIEKKARESQSATIDAKRAKSSKVDMSLQEDYEKNHKKYVDMLFEEITKE